VHPGEPMPAGPVPSVPGDLRLVGFEELSATAVRDRVLARRAEFWSGSALTEQAVVGLHDPLFFHQLGGFGAVALTGDGDDAGYLLGVVSADRLAVVHAVAVHPTWRGRGVATALLTRFAGLASGVGARAVQAVAVPGDGAARALADRFGAHAAPSAGHAGPDGDRVLYTRALPLG
jgi:GNAT superfamily N-acetyltransferase